MNLFIKIPPKDAGFFHVYVQDGRYYLEVPDDKLERDILVAVTIIKERHRKSGVRMLVSGMAGTPCMIG